MINYKTKRIIDGKPRWVVINEDGNVVNRNPSKEELKGLKIEPREPYDTRIVTKKEALDGLKRYCEKNGRPPVALDLLHNSEYPSSETYRQRFGSWSNALKSVEMDVELMVKKGVIETTDQKARFSEIIIRDHFEKNSVDLAGENKRSPCDGICPNGKMYDVKSSKLHYNTFYQFITKNKYKEEIEIYYFLAFNEDWTKLDYGWRVPGEIVERDDFEIGLNSRYEFNIENMKQYDITNELRDVLIKYGLLCH